MLGPVTWDLPFSKVHSNSGLLFSSVGNGVCVTFCQAEKMHYKGISLGSCLCMCSHKTTPALWFENDYEDSNQR